MNDLTIENSRTIFHKYVTIMNDYLNLFPLLEKYKKKEKDSLYLLINGFITLTHIFQITLNQTGVIQAVENTEKSIYYYTQFIEQMEENILYDLNISSNNASLFAYKKTIYMLPKTRVESIDKNIIKSVDLLLLIYRRLFDILLLGNIYDSRIPSKLINIAMELCRTNQGETFFQGEIQNSLLFLNHFAPHEQIVNIFKETIYDYIYIYIKLYKHHSLTLNGLCQKKIQSNYEEKLKESSATNYIQWLLV